METDLNKNIGSSGITKPGDLYLAISPEGKIRSVAAGNIMYDNFREFIYDAVYYTKKGKDAPYLNDTYLHYRFKDDRDVPYWKRDGTDEEYHQRINNTIKEMDLKPHQTIRLYHAMYCYENGLNPLLKENSEAEQQKLSAYKRAVAAYSGNNLTVAEKKVTSPLPKRGIPLKKKGGIKM